jgi:hypothetical protein
MKTARVRRSAMDLPHQEEDLSAKDETVQTASRRRKKSS